MYKSKVRGARQVEISDETGEGLWGDYDPEDAEDIPLLRFWCYAEVSPGVWEEMDDASYCTALPAEEAVMTDSRLEAVLDRILDVVEDVDSGYKRELESLSWLSPDDLTHIE